MIRPIMVDFRSWSLMLVWVMDAGFEKTWAISGKWIVAKAIPRLYEWKYNIFKAPCIISSTADSHQGGFPLKGVPIGCYNCRVPRRGPQFKCY